jgi:hypothetical protein
MKATYTVKIRYYILIICLLLSGCGGGSDQGTFWQWSKPEQSTMGLTEVATNSKGEFLVANSYSGSGSKSVDIYSPVFGWKGMHDIGNAIQITLAMNDNGQAVCVFWEGDVLKAVQYSPFNGWGDKQIIATGLSATYIKCVIDPDGRSTIVWSQVGNISNFTNLYFSRYDQLNGWTVPKKITFTENVYTSLGGIAVSKTGQILLLWTEINPANTTTFESILYKSVFSPESGWSTPEAFYINSGNLRMSKQMDKDDNVFMIFGTSGNGYAGRIGLSTPFEYKKLKYPSMGFPPINVSVNDSGSAFLTWVYFDGTPNGIPGICNITYSPESGWSNDDFIKQIPSSAIPGVFSRSYSGIDDSGNMFLSYIHTENGIPNIYVIRSTSNQSWLPPQKLSNNPIDVYASQLVVSPNGSALLNWMTIEGNTASPTLGNYLSFYRLTSMSFHP